MDDAAYVYHLTRGNYFEPDRYQAMSVEEGEEFERVRFGLSHGEERSLFCDPYVPWVLRPDLDDESGV